LERHHDPPVLRQLIENALCLRRVLHLEREGKPLWLLVALWCDVASHQYVITDGQTAVHDLVLPVVRDFASQRRATVPEDRADASAQRSFIALECLLAISAKAQVRRHLHVVSSSPLCATADALSPIVPMVTRSQLPPARTAQKGR